MRCYHVVKKLAIYGLGRLYAMNAYGGTLIVSFAFFHHGTLLIVKGLGQAFQIKKAFLESAVQASFIKEGFLTFDCHHEQSLLFIRCFVSNICNCYAEI